MSIEKIIARMRSDVEREIARIEAEAKEQADRILVEAKRRAEEEYLEIVKIGEKETDLAIKRMRSQAHMDAHDTVRAAKQRCISESFERATRVLHDLPRSTEFEAIQKGLIEEGLAGVGATTATIVASERDRPLVERLVSGIVEDGKNVSLAPEYADCIGGVIVRSSSGRMTVNNTFEARMERERERLIHDISKILFGDG
jgi:V/A-type H+/Na+-transporting ATPase subunit E